VDFIDDDVIDRLASIERNTLQTSTQRFRIVILPGIERISVSTLTKLAEFARSGGILISTRRVPSMAPDFLDQTTSTASVKRLVEELFEKPSHVGHFFADERSGLADELPRMHPPALAFSPPVPEVGFIHRSTERAEIYFICNTANKRVRTSAAFRIESRSPEWWDPFTGKVADAEALNPSAAAWLSHLIWSPMVRDSWYSPTVSGVCLRQFRRLSGSLNLSTLVKGGMSRSNVKARHCSWSVCVPGLSWKTSSSSQAWQPIARKS
jgi:hypothetical protein